MGKPSRLKLKVRAWRLRHWLITYISRYCLYKQNADMAGAQTISKLVEEKMLYWTLFDEIVSRKDEIL